MVFFHANGKPNLTIMYDEFRFVQVIEKCLYVMFGFLLGSIPISMDTTCDDKNIITNGIYELPLVGSHGLYWLVNISKYRIVGDQLLKG
jgi:hypothetical protein